MRGTGTSWDSLRFVQDWLVNRFIHMHPCQMNTLYTWGIYARCFLTVTP